VVVSVWVLDVAHVVVSGVVVAGNVAVVDGDVAVAGGGSERETRGWGASGGQQGCVGGGMSRRWGSWDERGRSVERTTRSDERVRT
jgi:hypothetical protein